MLHNIICFAAQQARLASFYSQTLKMLKELCTYPKNNYVLCSHSYYVILVLFFGKNGSKKDCNLSLQSTKAQGQRNNKNNHHQNKESNRQITT
jgi:hypothetical protein